MCGSCTVEWKYYARGVGVSVGEGKFCPFFYPSPKIFWCLRQPPRRALHRPRTRTAERLLVGWRRGHRCECGGRNIVSQARAAGWRVPAG